jgi:hypothetical protein
MATYKRCDYCKRKGDDTYLLKVDEVAVGPDGVEMVTVSWNDGFKITPMGTFRADELEPVDPNRSARRRTRRR